MYLIELKVINLIANPMKKSDIPEGIYIAKFTTYFNSYVLGINGEYFSSKINEFDTITSILFLKGVILKDELFAFSKISEEVYDLIKKYFITTSHSQIKSAAIVIESKTIRVSYDTN